MGLGAPKRRNKLSHDPNNTAWSRNSTNFGHRILASQGWQPGDYLGARDASHADHYSAANASHIRVQLREDNLGLGAKVGGNKAETFGLSLFSGVLGRLNGKSDGEVGKQQERLRDAELRNYADGKGWGLRFVSGGLLVGDRMKDKEEGVRVKKEFEVKSEDGKVKMEEDVEMKKEEGADEEKAVLSERKVKSRKRKARDDEGGEDETDGQTKKRRKAKADKDDNDEQVEDEANDRARRKEKKAKKRAAEASEGNEVAETARKEKKSKKRREKASQQDGSAPEDSADEKGRFKQEKRARKEERRKKKEDKRSKRAEKESAATESTKATIQQTQPANGGRHAVRHRYIQQKRMAAMDAQAMREIFMVKAA